MTFVRKIDDVVPFAEIERQDPKLPKGVKVLSQRGIPGFKTHRFRVVREGAFAVRERWNDSYPPTSQIIRVGTAEGGDAENVEDDPHPEYVADDYLVLLQGPDVKGVGPRPLEVPPLRVFRSGSGGGPSDASSREGQAGGMVELREAGRTGEKGWTERAGFSHYVAARHGKDDGDGCTGDCPVPPASESTRARRSRDSERKHHRARGRS